MNDLSNTELEAEWLALLVGIEDLAISELSDVAHADTVTLLCRWSGTNLLVVNLDALDGPDTELSLSLGGRLWGLRSSWALLKVLCKLDLLGILVGGSGLGSDGLSLVVLELLLLFLAQLLAIGAGLLHDLVKGLGWLLSGALVLSLLVSLSDKLGDLLIILKLEDAWVVKSV